MSTLPAPTRYANLIVIGCTAVILSCAQQGFGQEPLRIGELNVDVIGTGHETVEIRVFADPVFGSCSDWYQQVQGWCSYTDLGTFVGEHIDRGGGPNKDTIGYARYYVRINNRQKYVDFRDADYQTAAYNELDIWLCYSLDANKFYQIIDGDTVWTENGSGLGIWDNGRKSSGTPRIPVTVQNSYPEGNGSSVKVDGSYQNSPYQTIWETGSHSVEAHIFIAGRDGDYYFSSWSDGGNRAHTLSATLDDFAMTLTAYFDGLQAWQHLFAPSQSQSVCSIRFNPATNIRCEVFRRPHAMLTISNAFGQNVAHPVNAVVETGRHEFRFKAGARVSGLYFWRFQQEDHARILRLPLLN